MINFNLAAIFVSRCFNTPNVYLTFSPVITAAIANGYVLEFWFKIDNNFNSCAIDTGLPAADQLNFTYFYLYPHWIYNKVGTNDFFYKNIAVSVTSQLNLIHLYEWNKITITMTATSSFFRI